MTVYIVVWTESGRVECGGAYQDETEANAILLDKMQNASCEEMLNSLRIAAVNVQYRL